MPDESMRHDFLASRFATFRGLTTTACPWASSVRLPHEKRLGFAVAYRNVKPGLDDRRTASRSAVVVASSTRNIAMRLSPITRPPGLLGKLLDRVTRRMLGRSITPSQVIYNRVPAAWRITLAFQLYERYGARLPADLRLLVTTRVAQLNGCAFCQDIKRALAVRERMGIERFNALESWRTSAVFSAGERAALSFVEEATTSKQVSDTTFEELKRHFDDRQIAELTLSNAIENFYNLLNLPLQIESDRLETIAIAAQKPSSPTRVG
ncbi:MAG: carboxymuconolactone decarboxylase family protein [Vicinamibacterales bacterium]